MATPDERLLERYFEVFMGGLAALTHQVARCAVALETQVVAMAAATNVKTTFRPPCETCGCRLGTDETNDCPACRTHVRADG